MEEQTEEEEVNLESGYRFFFISSSSFHCIVIMQESSKEESSSKREESDSNSESEGEEGVSVYKDVHMSIKRPTSGGQAHDQEVHAVLKCSICFSTGCML